MIYIKRQRKGRIDLVVDAVKRFLRYLNECEFVNEDFSPALYGRMVKSSKILGAFTHEEVKEILSQPDRTTPIGKRDYAILLLGKNTGLRRGDIVALKRTDINWKSDELQIVQRKTGILLTLPLENNVLIAIMDYLLNGRPISELPNVFLRQNAPCTAMSPQLVGAVFQKYLSSAEIAHILGDGKSFHGLRRSIARWMLEADVPLTTISQVLGHRSLNSANPYVSVDERNLCQCAISLHGIELSKEGLL